MILDLYFSRPELLYAIPLLLILGILYILTRAKNKLLAATRLVIFCLIIAAAANPYFVETHTVLSEKPTIAILEDRTGSMEVFDPGVAGRVSAFADAEVRSFTGDKTPLGDKILQYSLPGETLVLVSDGYSNSGRALPDALALVRASNATVFAISQDPIKEDSSVEISGTNTAVLGGDYPFTVIIRSSGRYHGPLSVLADDRPIYSGEVSANENSSIKISNAFLETGNHILRATIASDIQPVNNDYQKAIYVVPKPEVLLISDRDSPLARDLSSPYKLTMVSELPAKLQGYKAVVLDDQRYSSNLDVLKNYVREGGGLVIVGGQNSFDFGGYHNSPLEEVLPVQSFPSTFEGGKTLVFILDISFSLLSTRTGDGTPLLDYEKALAVELLKSPDFQDYKVGLVVFGTKAYDVQDPVPLSRGRSLLEERIAGLAPTGTQDTYLDSGLQLAWDMLNASGGQGELIVLSDGNLWNYEDVLQHSVRLLEQMNTTVRLIQVQAIPGRIGRFDELASQTGSEYAAFIYPASLTTKVSLPSEEKIPEEETLKGYPIAVANKNHYITSDLELNSTITGFNDVTPRSGAQRLVVMADGKPVLTTWRYGLGRVAAFTSDDGSAWAGSVYAAPSSQLISSTVNWAVGDPRPEDNRVEAEDGWQGTPLQITIDSNALPSLPGTSVEKVGDKRYVATLIPNSTGIYYIGDYGVAVNYPLEYRDIGFNPELSRLIMANGGKVFTEDEARKSLIAEAGRLSQRTAQERVSRRDLLLLLALAIFLVDVVVRKAGEIRRRGRSRRSAP
ncbi:Putative glutamine amidotransferase [uncultured archaeon]|nr:Putative glutamine amidotransferase [uncultured archaeon]